MAPPKSSWGYPFPRKEYGAAAVVSGTRRDRDTPPPTLCRELIAELKEYLQTAYISCAGLAFRDNIPLWDRALWCTAVLASAGYTGWLVLATFLANKRSPLETVVVTSTLHLDKFPFPSVTICPRSKIRKSVALSIIAEKNNLSSVDEADLMPALRLLQTVRFRQWITYEKPTKIKPEVARLFEKIPLFDFMKEVLPDCHDMFRDCYWASKPIDCCDYFRLQLTRSGFCYSFNSLTSTETDGKCADKGGQDKRDAIWHHQRPKTRLCQLFVTSGTGPDSALEVYLKHQNPADKLGKGTADVGYLLVLAAAKDYPDPEEGVYVPEAHGMVTHAAMTYWECAVSPDVRELHPLVRGCIFEDESDQMPPPDKNWYSQRICFKECHLKLLFDRCGCYPYLSSPNGQEAQTCDLLGHECLVRESAVLLNGEIANCSCSPVCGGSEYRSNLHSTRSISPLVRNSSAAITVFYRDWASGMKYSRQLRMDHLDKLVIYGGLLNLLLGISLVSVAQVPFHCAKAVVLIFRRRWQVLRGRPARRRPRDRPHPTLKLGVGYAWKSRVA